MVLSLSVEHRHVFQRFLENDSNKKYEKYEKIVIYVKKDIYIGERCHQNEFPVNAHTK